MILRAVLNEPLWPYAVRFVLWQWLNAAVYLIAVVVLQTHYGWNDPDMVCIVWRRGEGLRVCGVMRCGGVS